MSHYVTVEIVCPCGRLLMTRNNNAESNSVTSGSKRCPSCKREVSYQVIGDHAHTSYKD